MTRTLVIILFLLAGLTSFGQKLDDFKSDIEKATKNGFNEGQLNQLFRKYPTLLTPHSDITQFTANIKGDTIQQYPIADFKNDKLYKQNINDLFQSGNSNHRILSYLLIAGTGDKTFESGLLNKLKTETEKGNLIWAGMALLYLNTAHTTPLFDFIVENEIFGDAQMLPLFIQLNNDSLRETAYRRIKSDNLTAQILAAQTLSYTKLNTKTEKLLKESVSNWSIENKGYAIYSIKELQIGNLLETFKPLLDSTQTRSIALEALANSPTKEDRRYLFDLVEKQDTISKELLDCFLQSKNTENIKYWLTLLYTKPIPQKYIFFVFKQPILSSDEILTDLHIAFEKITDPEILHELVRALKGRTDDKSERIMISLVKHDNSKVRYWAAESLKGNSSPLLVKELPSLLSNPETRTFALVDLAIQSEIDTLQNLFESIYSNNPNRDWKRSSIGYLSMFPFDKHKEIFRAILKDDSEDTFTKRNAALGLGRLRDKESVDLIIEVCEQESSTSDFNALPFLVALRMIKGDRAKREIEKYKNSHEVRVAELVEEILDKW
ncbi:MAG: HEAT repeat domain-containing protein [Bacteroidota bacterium]